MLRLKLPIEFFGGKFSIASRIINLFPEHRIYVEPFCGSAGVFWSKERGGMEVLNDKDSELMNFYRVLSDKGKFLEFFGLASNVVYSRVFFNEARRNVIGDDIYRALMLWVVGNIGFNGYRAKRDKSWGRNVTGRMGNRAKRVSIFLKKVEQLFDIHSRLCGVELRNDDGLEVIREFDSESTLFYCDPPYIWSTRRRGGFAVEMTDDEHLRLLELLCKVRGKVILSGYHNEIYDKWLSGWRLIEWRVPCRAVGCTVRSGTLGEGGLEEKGQYRVECVWLNF